MAKPKAWRIGAAGEPALAPAFDIPQRAALQWTDIVSNHNKYYAIELHAGKDGPKGSSSHRVFTHYGRTDDLENNAAAGAKESRYFDDAASATACYQQIYREKTAKGYKEVSLASSKVGSQSARGHASGEVDAKTLEKIEGEKERRAAAPASSLPSELQRLIRYTRYADDLTFSGDDRVAIGPLLACVRKVIASEGFREREDKTHIMGRGRRQEVTGVVVNDKLAVPRDERRALRALLHNCATSGLASQNHEKREDFVAFLRGKVSFAAMVDPSQREKLDRALARALGR